MEFKNDMFSYALCSQYLDMRFKSRLVRCIASFTYVIRSLLNLGVTVFTPCVALKTVIGMPYWASILSITVISIIFTIMGGLKAAITADVVQGLTMLACSFAIIIQELICRTMLANIPVITVLFSLSWIAGMVIFGNYADCDPLSLGFISKIDEILPFYIEDKFLFIPGLLGVFMASLFNGALSLSVSNLNSLATVTWEDFVSQIPACRNFTDKKQLLVIKIIVSILLQGAVTGMILSHIVTLWITFGGLTLEKPPITLLPLSTAGCTNDSFSHFGTPSTPTHSALEEYKFEWFNHSNSEQSLYDYDVFNNNVSSILQDAIPINKEPEYVIIILAWFIVPTLI
ncbi:hypothetical protein C0J52_09913 [Blattella germanica]|nr:hypothetical protein C0J52_09913 [Blattella germanica]